MHGRRKVAVLVAMVVMISGMQRLTAQAPSVTVGGLVYAKYYYNLSDTAGHLNNFDLDRAYLNVNGKFAYGIGGRLTSDLYANLDGSLALRIKYAYASWNKDKSPITLKFGAIQTPWLDWEEHLWDYRMQGTMAIERGGYTVSSDLGLSVDGNYGYDRFNFTAGVYNGESYKVRPGDKGKDFMARASFRILGTDEGTRSGGLRLTGYGQVGTPTNGGTRTRYIGMLSYRSKLLTAAGEFAGVSDSAGGTTGSKSLKQGTVGSFYAIVRIPKSGVALVARYDVTDPDRTKTDDRQDRIIGGVSYTPSGNLRLLADIDHVTYQGNVAPTPAAYAARTQALLQVQLSF